MSDVARLAEVSTMTVSRVLNGSSSVTDGLRERVFAAVEQLNYRPNEVARSLREQRSRQIGIVLPYLFDPFFASCAHVISSVARERAYSVVLATSNEDPQAEFDEASRMLSRHIDGLLVIPARSSARTSLLQSTDFERLPLVTLDRPIPRSRFDSVLVENERGTRLGTEHLLKLGHKRIAYVGLENDLYTIRMRHRGYRKAMQAAGLETRELFLSGELHTSLAGVAGLLSAGDRPTALLSSNNLITRHVLQALQRLGLHPPDPVALVGFDDFEIADLLRPGITVVRQPNEAMGRCAAEMLFDRIADNADVRSARNRVLPVELVVRGSCGAVC